jgi:hypothetical protein
MEPKDPDSRVAAIFIEGISIQAELFVSLDKFVM